MLTPFPPVRDDDDDDDDDSDSDALPTVLDCGFAGGAWIERMLEEFGGNLDVSPAATSLVYPFASADTTSESGSRCSNRLLTVLHQITGVDIYLGEEDDEDNSNGNGADFNAVQEFIKKRWNLNAPFSRDRSEDRLVPDSFDLINSRYLAEGINADRWTTYVRELGILLKPGGWLQMVEIQFPFQSQSGRLPDDSYLRRWWDWYAWTLERLGKNVRIGRELEQRMRGEQRFRQVRAQAIDVPVGEWNPGAFIPPFLLHRQTDFNQSKSMSGELI